jgi:hypothetical protein
VTLLQRSSRKLPEENKLKFCPEIRIENIEEPRKVPILNLGLLLDRKLTPVARTLSIPRIIKA